MSISEWKLRKSTGVTYPVIIDDREQFPADVVADTLARLTMEADRWSQAERQKPVNLTIGARYEVHTPEGEKLPKWTFGGYQFQLNQSQAGAVPPGGGLAWLYTYVAAQELNPKGNLTGRVIWGPFLYATPPNAGGN